ncbi:MAG: hypothetical protein VR73_08915 [Gammaproteobacteria bacterium BRH_c0]|nr:MAG: hypothetical protein VR73_08915 [Gammaproteobacteria bacterium BRH_c0]
MKNLTQPLFDLTGKTAIVTGAGQGIGRGIAEGLATAGASIVIADINSDTMSQTSSHIRETCKVEVMEFSLDVRREEQVLNLMDETIAAFGSLDILVNNAGIVTISEPQSMSMEDWDKTMDINLRSVFVLCQNAYHHLKKSANGKIINIASIYAIFGAQYLPSYAASKSGLVQLTRSLAIAWAPDNIQANCILPGWINTPLSIEGRKNNPAAHDIVVGRTPAGRWGDPQDLAGTAIFLASGASQYVTGVSIPVDGGYSIN